MILVESYVFGVLLCNNIWSLLYQGRHVAAVYCTLSHPFYSSEAGCQNKSCLPQILVYLVFHLIPVHKYCKQSILWKAGTMPEIYQQFLF